MSSFVDGFFSLPNFSLIIPGTWHSDFRKDLLQNNLSCVEFEVFVGASPDSGGLICQGAVRTRRSLTVPLSLVYYLGIQLVSDMFKNWAYSQRPQHSECGHHSSGANHSEKVYRWSKWCTTRKTHDSNDQYTNVTICGILNWICPKVALPQSQWFPDDFKVQSENLRSHPRCW